METTLDDPGFPEITYRRGASGIPQPVLRSSGLRVQTIVLAGQAWGLTPDEIASQYALSLHQVEDCLRLYEGHRAEIDLQIEAEDNLAQIPPAEDP